MTKTVLSIAAALLIGATCMAQDADTAMSEEDRQALREIVTMDDVWMQDIIEYNMILGNGDVPAGIAILDGFIAQSPKHFRYYFFRGLAHLHLRQDDKAYADFTRGVTLAGEADVAAGDKTILSEMHWLYATASFARGLAADAIPALEAYYADVKELEDKDAMTQCALMLTMVYASHPDAEVRDGEKALLWAKRAGAKLEGENEVENYVLLGTALAANGNFSDATVAQTRAIMIVSEAVDEMAADDPNRSRMAFVLKKMREVRDLYESGKPFVNDRLKAPAAD